MDNNTNPITTPPTGPAATAAQFFGLDRDARREFLAARRLASPPPVPAATEDEETMEFLEEAFPDLPRDPTA